MESPLSQVMGLYFQTLSIHCPFFSFKNLPGQSFLDFFISIYYLNLDACTAGRALIYAVFDQPAPSLTKSISPLYDF